ncbi:MAG: NAD(P)H-quinone oxidoreductase [Bergeyella cardium]
MKAIHFNGAGGAEVIALVEVPIPTPQHDELLIKVHTAGINGSDVMQRKGLYAPPKGITEIPGLEVSGRVAQADAAGTFAVGQEVCALIQGGGYAEYAIAKAENTVPIPAGLSLTEAGGFLETFMTIWAHLFQFASFSEGKSILIHGGASGIGTTATMLARAFGVSQIFTTVSHKENQIRSVELGADVAINYREEDFVQVVKQHTEGRGVDYVLDLIAGPYVQQNYDVAAMYGTIVQVGVMQGKASEVDFFPMLAKRLTHLGATLRSQSPEQKAQVLAALQEKVYPLISQGIIKPVIYKVYPLSEARAAHEELDRGGHFGKFVLNI